MVIAAAALAGEGQIAAAAPAEPLVVANLREPVLEVVVMRDPESVSASGETLRFARALDDAAIAQRQAVARRCRSADPIPARGPARDAWEANCRYTRR